MKEQTRAEPRFSLCGLNCGCARCTTSARRSTARAAAARAVPPARCSGARGSTAAWNTASSARNIPVPVTPGPSLMTPSCPTAMCKEILPGRPGTDWTHIGPCWRKRRRSCAFCCGNTTTDGRKSLFCTAVNLLELADVRETVSLLRRQTPPDAALREKGALAARLLQEAAAANGICLKLNRKKK